MNRPLLSLLLLPGLAFGQSTGAPRLDKANSFSSTNTFGDLKILPDILSTGIAGISGATDGTRGMLFVERTGSAFNLGTNGQLLLTNPDLTKYINVDEGTFNGDWTHQGLQMTVGSTIKGGLTIATDENDSAHDAIIMGLNLKFPASGAITSQQLNQSTWGWALERDFFTGATGSRGVIQHEAYLEDNTADNAHRPLIMAWSQRHSATVTSVTNGAVVLASAPITEFVKAGMRFKFTALTSPTDGLAADTTYWVKTVTDQTHFTISATQGGAQHAGDATGGTMERGGYGALASNVPFKVNVYSYDSPDIRSITAFEVENQVAGQALKVQFSNAVAGSVQAFHQFNSEFKMGLGAVYGGTHNSFDISPVAFTDTAWSMAPTTGWVKMGYATDASAVAPASRLDVNGTITATGFSGSGASLTGTPVATSGVNAAGYIPMAAATGTASQGLIMNDGLLLENPTGFRIVNVGEGFGRGSPYESTGRLKLWHKLSTFYTQLAAANATADRTITFPDATGTLALTSDITGGTLAGSFTTLGASTSATTPLIYGGTAANGAMDIESTSHATRATAYLRLQRFGGFVGIGLTTPTEALHVSGNILASGAISAGSTLSSGNGASVVARAGSSAGVALYSPSDGIARLTNFAGSGFTRLNLGHVSAANFPALAVTSATPPTMTVIAADGSGSSHLTISGALTAQSTLAVTGASTLTGNLTSNGALISTPQALSGSGALTAINTTTLITTVATSGASTTTLGAGTSGQIKVVSMITDGGDCVVTPSAFTGTTFTLNDAEDTVTLIYLNSRWVIQANNGATVP